MTESRYFQILDEYQIWLLSYPTKEKIESMSEEQLIKQMEAVKKVFEQSSICDDDEEGEEW